MPNLVDITIRANDATGPGFASALARAEALKKALNSVGSPGIDMSHLDSQLSLLKAKLQAHGVADLLDINMNQGQIESQLMLLRRKIENSKVTDILDVNLNESQVQRQMADIEAALSNRDVTIGVNASLVDAGLVAAEQRLMSRNIPINITPVLSGNVDLGNLPVHGETMPIKVVVSGTGDVTRLAADADIAALSIGKLRAEIGLLTAQTAASAAQEALLAVQTDIAQSKIDNLGTKTQAAGGVLGVFGGVLGALGKVHIPLFGGALTSMGLPPIIAAASGFHLLSEAVIETTAVVGPAAIAFVAFGAAAVPAAMSIYSAMKTAYTVSQAFGTSMPGLSGGFSKMAQAVQPEVYTLFGEALVVANNNTGIFQKVAVAAGSALDILGARAAAALVSGGMGTFLKEGPADLAKIGDIIGNVFGIIGNLLKAVPGYAVIGLDALDLLSRGLEAVTSNAVVQDILKWGLAFHGAFFYIGLAATGVTVLGNAIAGLAVKMGLLSAGTTLFDATAFANGLTQAAGGAALMSKEMVTLGASEDIAAAGAITMEGIMTALAAVSPVVWAAIAVAGMYELGKALGGAANEAENLTLQVQKAISATPIDNAALIFANEYKTVLVQLAQEQATYNASLDQNHTHSYYRDLQQQIGDTKALLPEISNAQNNYNILLDAAGHKVSNLSAAGITMNDVLNAGTNSTGHLTAAMQQLIVRVEAQVQAQDALSIGTGRTAAANNALNNSFITGSLPALQKVTQAEDALLTLVTSGRTSFNDFQQAIQGTTAKFKSPSGLADAMKLAKGDLTGLNDQSLAYSNTLYTQAIPSLQKMVDSLQQQNISTKDLTTVVATGAGEITKYIGTNTEARSVIVDLINNALGPGTVSLKTLNSWISQNSTSLTGMNAIVAKSTVAAGALASVLQNDLNKAFQDSLFKASGAQQAINAMTKAIVNGGTSTTAYKSARDQLIADLEKTGLSAHDAKAYVDHLQGSIDALHGKGVTVGVTADGTGQIKISGTGINTHYLNVATGQVSAGGGHTAATGWLVTGGTPGKDSVVAIVSPGELIVPKSVVDSGAVDNLRGKIPGFASGGIVHQSAIDQLGTDEVTMGQTTAALMTQAAVQAALDAYKVKVTSGGGGGGGYAGPGGGSPAANVALAQRVLGWTGGQFQDLVNLWTRESGWNQFAYNASSGATGIPQSLPYTKMPRAAWLPFQGGQANVLAQETWGDSYIRSVYGTPSNAWAHELSHGWYDQGGWLKPGWTMAYNGTGKPERVMPPSASQPITLEITSGGNSAFEQFMLQSIRNWVRVKGGGNVQAAFGRNS